MRNKWGYHPNKHNITSGSIQDQGQRRGPKIKIKASKSNRPHPSRHGMPTNAGSVLGRRQQHRTTKDPHWSPGHTTPTLGLEQRRPSTEATRSEIIRPYHACRGTLEHYQHKHNTLATRCSLSEHETTRQFCVGDGPHWSKTKPKTISMSRTLWASV